MLKRVVVYLDPKTIKKIRKEAHELQKSFSFCVRKALYLEYDGVI